MQPPSPPLPGASEGPFAQPTAAPLQSNHPHPEPPEGQNAAQQPWQEQPPELGQPFRLQEGNFAGPSQIFRQASGTPPAEPPPGSRPESGSLASGLPGAQQRPPLQGNACSQMPSSARLPGYRNGVAQPPPVGSELMPPGLPPGQCSASSYSNSGQEPPGSLPHETERAAAAAALTQFGGKEGIPPYRSSPHGALNGAAQLNSPGAPPQDGRLPAMTSEPEEVVAPLCPSIWSHLPDEVVELVLERVPFSSLVQFRLVCKKWNSVIMSSDFSQACHKQVSPKCVPVLVANDLMESRGWTINPYNSESNSWLSYPLSFLEQACQTGPLYLTASSGGLMCFETEDRRNFIICNPITRRWRHLELPDSAGESIRTTASSMDSDYRHTLTGLVVDQTSGNYKLVTASLAKCAEMRTLIYDSAERSWTRGAEVPAGKRFVNPGALTCNGNLYCLVKNPRGLEERTCIWRVVKYEVQYDNWCEAPVVTGWPGNSSTELELVEHQGKVLLVARVLNRRWLPNNTFYRVWYNTFFKVCESLEGQKLSLVQERKVFQSLDRSTGSTEFKTVVSKYPGSFAGNGDLIFTTGIPFTNNNEVQVLKVNSRTQNCLFLPVWRREDVKCKMQMEIRLLEPSLTAAV